MLEFASFLGGGPLVVGGPLLIGGTPEAVAATAGGASLAPLIAFLVIVSIHQHMINGEMDEVMQKGTLIEKELVEEKWP